MNDTEQLSSEQPDTGTTSAPGTLIGRLAKAQKQMGPATKDAKNPHFNSSYATLQSVMAVALPALSAQGIALIQATSTDGSHVTTTLACEGDETRLTCIVPLTKWQNMQQFGSAVTYARRYGLMMICGIAPADDDDGNQAGQGKPEHKSDAPKKEGIVIEQVVGRIRASRTIEDLAGARAWCAEKGLMDHLAIREAINDREHDLLVRQ